VAAALVARYELSPGQLAAAFEYDLRAARGSVAEWTFLADPALRVTDVVANGRVGWQGRPAGGAERAAAGCAWRCASPAPAGRC
jgi:hypothetical protein